MGNDDYSSGYSTLKISNAQKNQFDKLRKKKTVAEFFSELLETYEKPRPKNYKPKKEKKLTPYGPVIKELSMQQNFNKNFMARLLGIHPDEVCKVESGELELEGFAIRRFANKLNIYETALEKGLVIPLPKELRR